MAHVVGINVVEGVLKDNQQLLTEQICAYSYHVPGWRKHLSPHKRSAILAASLRLLLETPGSTLLNLLDILKDNTLQQSSDPIVPRHPRRHHHQRLRDPVASSDQTFALSSCPHGAKHSGPEEITLGEASIIIANLDRAKLGDTTANS